MRMCWPSLIIFYIVFILHGAGLAYSVQWLGYRLGDPGFESRQGQDIYLFSKMTIPGPEPTKHPMQWVLGALSGIKTTGA
jgi:hypothetical protein